MYFIVMKIQLIFIRFFYLIVNFEHRPIHRPTQDNYIHFDNIII